MKAGCNNADPLARFSLIGHSAGGVGRQLGVAQRGAGIMAGLDKAIRWQRPSTVTAASSIGGSRRRLPQRCVQHLQKGNHQSDLFVSRAVTSGCFFLTPSSCRTGGARRGSRIIRCASYPSVDLTYPDVIADPYDPQTNLQSDIRPATKVASIHRARTAKAVVTFLSSSLTQAQANKFWNIRGDTLAGNTRNTTTVGLGAADNAVSDSGRGGDRWRRSAAGVEPFATSASRRLPPGTS